MWDFFTQHSLMEMEHIQYCMAAFKECNLHSWIQSAVFYYDVISIQLNPEISILTWTDICIDTTPGNFKH
jgi:hypothetical protein